MHAGQGRIDETTVSCFIKNESGVEIDDLMPVGGAGDVEPDDAKRELKVSIFGRQSPLRL